MNVTFRTDWLDPADPHRNQVVVSYHGADLKAARAMACKMSRATGSAYVIKTVDGTDVAHLPYTDGRADGNLWLTH
jgi:hypothetical protein